MGQQIIFGEKSVVASTILLGRARIRHRSCPYETKRLSTKIYIDRRAYRRHCRRACMIRQKLPIFRWRNKRLSVENQLQTKFTLRYIPFISHFHNKHLMQRRIYPLWILLSSIVRSIAEWFRIDLSSTDRTKINVCNSFYNRQILLLLLTFTLVLSTSNSWILPWTIHEKKHFEKFYLDTSISSTNSPMSQITERLPHRFFIVLIVHKGVTRNSNVPNVTLYKKRN